MQDNDIKNSKSTDKGSKSRSLSMDEQSHYKQDQTKTRQSINAKSHIFNVREDNDKSKQTPTRMSSVVRRSLKKETSTLGEIVSLNYIKSNKNVIGLRRSKTIEQTTSLLANNADLKAQVQEKVFAIAALKNDLRKLKGNSVDTKFAKTSVLGKPVLQSLRNQSVVRQPNAFKSKRSQLSKP
ncbi:hypothetical protein Tco_0393045 [Tanacetum coccineum]